MKKVQQRKQKGFTLVELGIVLALIGIGLFFAISKITETNEQSRAQGTATDLALAVNNLKRLYATQNAFPAMGTAIGTEELRNNAIFPSAWNITTTAPGGQATNGLLSPFGTVPTANSCAVPTNATPAGTYSCITIPGVPSRVCTELARIMSSGMVAIGVAATGGTATLVKPWAAPLNTATVGTQCVAAANVDMAFYFTRS
jgi:type IV pilus assembly protein PilA